MMLLQKELLEQSRGLDMELSGFLPLCGGVEVS